MSGESRRLRGALDGDTQSRAAGLSRLRRFERHLGRRILSGLLVLIPLLITVFVLRFAIAALDSIFRPALKGIPYVENAPGIGVVITLVLLYVIGVFFAGKRSQAIQDAVLTRVPIARSIYSVARQATLALSSPMSDHFSRVVFVEYPRPGIKAMGFVTGHIHTPGDDKSAIAVVYIPTVPNPTSGMLAWVPEDQVIETNFSVEEAMKAVFSGGIVLPEMPPQQSLPAGSQLDE